MNNSQGAKLFKDVSRGDNSCLARVPLKFAIKGNANIAKSSVLHGEREAFFNNLDKLPFGENVEKCLNGYFDCAIVNYWWSLNYGAMLTAYALQTAIKMLGYNPKNVFYEDYASEINKTFADKYLLLTDRCQKEEDFILLNNFTKIFITGSDQVFRPAYCMPFLNTVFLNFVSLNNKKTAFAASFGVDYLNFPHPKRSKIKRKFLKFFEPYYKKDSYIINKIKNNLKMFDYISVRELSGIDICKKEFDCNVEYIIDPVFMLQPDDYDILINNANINYSGKICTYVLDENNDYEKFYDVISKKFNKEVVRMGKVDTSPENWLSAIKNCEFIVTDSFHGVCFSLIFRKKFICIKNKDRGNARFNSLFKIFGIEHAGVYDLSSLYDRKNLFEDIDYDKVGKIIERERKKALNKLHEILNSPKKITPEHLVAAINLQRMENAERHYDKSLKGMSKKIILILVTKIYHFLQIVKTHKNI